MIFSIIIRLIIYGFVLYEITHRYIAHKGLTFRDVVLALILMGSAIWIVEHLLTPIDWSELQ